MDLFEVANQKATLSVEKIENEKIALMNCVEGMTISNDSELAIATDLLKSIKGRMKWLEEDRKSITDPINKALRLINGKYKPSYEFLEVIAHKLDSEKIVPYSHAQFVARKQEEERLRLEEFNRKVKEAEELARIANEQGSEIAEEFAKKAEVEALNIAGKKLEVSQTTRTENATVNTIRGRWVCEIVDESLVPREFCMPHPTLLNKAVSEGIREIAGCVIKEVFSSSTR